MQLGSLQKQLATIQQQLDRVDRLIRIADPDGWYQPGRAEAEAAKARAKQAMEEERKKRAAAVERRNKAQQEAQPFTPEVEDDVNEQAGVAGADSQTSGSSSVESHPSSRGENISNGQGAAVSNAAKPTVLRSNPSPVASLHRIEPDAMQRGGLQIRRPATATGTSADAQGVAGSTSPTPSSSKQGGGGSSIMSGAESAKQQYMAVAQEMAAQFAEGAGMMLPPANSKKTVKVRKQSTTYENTHVDECMQVQDYRQQPECEWRTP